MTDLGLLGGGTLGLLAALVLVIGPRLPWRRRYPERQTVVVNTAHEHAFRGVLWQRTREHLVLKQAQLLHGEDKPVPIDFEVLIPIDEVEFVQVLSAPVGTEAQVAAAVGAAVGAQVNGN